jgi:hypothetical protein
MLRRVSQLAAAVTLLTLAILATATAGRTATPNPRLLASYEPMMQFDPLEHFLPTKVQSFITDASLEKLTAPETWSVVKPHAAPGHLPRPGSGTWRLNERACTPASAIGGLACYAAAGNQGGGGPTVYGRVAHEHGKIILQYWFFYYDDVYSYVYPPSNFLWQAHEGDWENVNVVLNGDDRQPLYVGYSQHCSGQKRAWADTPRFHNTHPEVHVALGSHANYFTAGTHPINTACIPAEALAILNQLHLALPVDYALPGGSIAGPPRSGGRVMPVKHIGDNVPTWVRFPGFWGELQYLHINVPPPDGTTVTFGTSPTGPAFHDEWSDPLETLATWPTG